MPTYISAILAALISLFPSSPSLPCMVRRAEDISLIAAQAAADYEIPIGLLYAVGMRETHLGCDRGSGGNWGAPISASQRHTPGTPGSAASALRAGYSACHSWLGAANRFRCGLCRCPSFPHYANQTLSLARRLYLRANLPVPEELE